MHLDPDHLTRLLTGVDPEKQRERHRAEIQRLEAERESFSARAKHAESEAKWGRLGAIAAAVSAVVAVTALLVAVF
jgi:hypothetical protein